MSKGLFIPIGRTERLLSKSDALVAWARAHRYVAAHAPTPVVAKAARGGGGKTAAPRGPTC